ncbi:F0F1 ATP synthase subunit delta [Ornithinibacillus sp. BX22]|uniref:ATP synthase subunit delta n=2 Tax=Ornithinibacillus TaxID=484508 RepID=A0A923L368_9BACI|nr:MULTISPECIES: F0F1 ATP synthase subunit delta [Ornithinibacillus]MBC5635639.1 F0F1 ATP synthase subunit delta [Ornithinibacillus hominis]MBS3679250.1 F0F1 ATP synthase subunit delta [Ornithinibacillus massiliensis]
MSEAVVAKRYADALFQLASEKATLNEVLEELRVVRQVFNENSELQTFLAHPRVTNDKKRAFLDEVFKGVSKDVLNTLKLLVERHRLSGISDVVDTYESLVNEASGVAQGKVYSVRELSDAEKTELENSFAKRLNKSVVKLENVVDPHLVGGVKIRMGNTIYDGTISGKLRRIEQNIKLANI